MPHQVKPEHHARIETLVAQAKAGNPDASWGSEELAEYVNKHYGDGIKFHVSPRQKKGNLRTHLTKKGFVDDDAKAGNYVSAYGVTNLANASMDQLTQPLCEDQHDPELITGYASVCVDWSGNLPGRNFRVHSRRFSPARAYPGVHARQYGAPQGQVDQIDFAAVDPNDDTLQDGLAAARDGRKR